LTASRPNLWVSAPVQLCSSYVSFVFAVCVEADVGIPSGKDHHTSFFWPLPCIFERTTHTVDDVNPAAACLPVAAGLINGPALCCIDALQLSGRAWAVALGRSVCHDPCGVRLMLTDREKCGTVQPLTYRHGKQGERDMESVTWLVTREDDSEKGVRARRERRRLVLVLQAIYCFQK
jgi:hypothetical protein